jgi:hypothetical protein
MQLLHHAATARHLADVLFASCNLWLICRSVVVGVSVEKLTHDRYKWRGEDIANINKIAQRWVHVH